jgi:hypothetical protein
MSSIGDLTPSDIFVSWMQKISGSDCRTSRSRPCRHAARREATLQEMILSSSKGRGTVQFVWSEVMKKLLARRIFAKLSPAMKCLGFQLPLSALRADSGGFLHMKTNELVLLILTDLHGQPVNHDQIASFKFASNIYYLIC